MKISIIITTYDRPQYLRGAIDSVLCQSFKDFELIIVNDDPRMGEADKIIDSYKDSRIVYVKNKKNLAGAKSLNTGLRLAKGAYIAILDDDDVWNYSKKIEEQVRFLEYNPEYVLVGTNVIVVNYNNGKEITRTCFATADNELRRNIFSSNPFAHSSVMYRKDKALLVGGYDESLERGKDYDLWLRLGKTGKMMVLSGHYLSYREASFQQRNIISMRKKDAQVVLSIIWRYRKDYPNYLIPYVRQWIRVLFFSSLEIFQKIVGANSK